MAIKRVALLTAGGFAPCLSTTVADLIQKYNFMDPTIEVIGYRYGYEGLLRGDSLVMDHDARIHAEWLKSMGGSPIGNSRVKLTNTQDLIDRGLIEEGQNALQVAAEQLTKDHVDVLHTIGGDDTNSTAADLATYLYDNNYDLTVVGIPKSIDNDIYPIRQSLGRATAAEEGARYAQHVIGECKSSPRMLIIHEMMGRDCGYLAARTTYTYHEWVKSQKWVPSAGLAREPWDVHALYIPELELDVAEEAERLRVIMDRVGTVNIFLSESAGLDAVVASKRAAGETVARDAFGHIRLDTVNPGQWFATHFSYRLGAQKVLVEKSGYFSRAWKSNAEDLELIDRVTTLAVRCGLERLSGVVGEDEEADNMLSLIDFRRLKGGKPFNIHTPWFRGLIDEIGQRFRPRHDSEVPPTMQK